MIAMDWSGQAQLTPAFMKAIKHVGEEPLNDVQNLKVMFVDCHLKIQTSELGHVAVRHGVLRPAHYHHGQHAVIEDHKTIAD